MFEDIIQKHGLFILLTTLLFSIIFADEGIYGHIKTRLDIRKINNEIKKLELENGFLTMELEKLKKNDQYLEDVVRKKHGLLRDGERLYRIEER